MPRRLVLGPVVAVEAKKATAGSILKKNCDKHIIKAANVSAPSALSGYSLPVEGNATKQSRFPDTDFTPHVKQLLELADFDGGCGSVFKLIVLRPYLVPIVQCPCRDKNLVSISWCIVLKRIFEEKRLALPRSITMSFSRSEQMTDKNACK